MKLVERYIFRRSLTITLVTLCATTAVVLTTQVLLHVDVLTDSGESLLAFLKLSLMLVPNMVSIVMPFAILIGASQTLNTMNTDSELAVIEAAGGARSVTARPIILIGVILSLVALCNSLWLEPRSNHKLRDILNAASADLVRYAVQSGSFQKLQDKLYIQIAEELPGGAFGGIFLVDDRKLPDELIYYAKRGSIATVNGRDILLMQNGEIQRKNEDTGSVSIITFASYALDFSNFSSSASDSFYFPKERPTSYLISPDPNDPIMKTAPWLMRDELHRRLSDWLYPLAFALIAIYFAGSARANRDERMWSLFLAGLVALGFRAAGHGGDNYAGEGGYFATLPYLVPLSAIVLFSLLIATGRKAWLSQSWIDGFSAAAAGAVNAGQSFRRTIFGNGGQQARGDT